MRLGVSDISGTVTSITPTQLAPGPAWNRIVPPTGDPLAYRNDNFVVFTLPVAGSGAAGSIGKRPVLILEPGSPGFQVSLDYQSPNGQWYSYSFLQGNNATSTWITANPGFCLATSFSQYGQPTGYTAPTIVNSSAPSTATLWSGAGAAGISALAQAPIFAKADPRSIRYNSQIGVVNVINPPMPFASAGIIASIWPSPYATPPPMTPSAFPVPTPAGSPNPAVYSQLGDNGPAGSNPYSDAAPANETDFTHNDPVRPVMMNRPFLA